MRSFSVILIFCLSNLGLSQTVVNYPNPGAQTWVCPANVDQVIVECWGGGGGGGNSANNAINGGCGGGGGAYAKKTFSVVAGNSYYLTIGAGGAGAPAFSTTLALSGQDSWFNLVNQIPTNSSAVLAKGGVRGLNNSVANPNNGGSVFNSYGDIVFGGGNGYQGSSSGGGGGGSSASLLGTGVSSINYLGAIANSGGGNGGNAGITSSNGLSGSIPGGGGGGSDDSQARYGGNGAQGLIKITYFVNCSGTPNTGIVSVSSPNGCEGTSVTLTASNLTTEQGISYQWQFSNDNINWIDISGANSTLYTMVPTNSAYYRIKSICSFSGLVNYSQSVQYIVYPIPSTPVISVSGNTTFCQGNNVVLSSNVVSGLTYQWKNNSLDLPGETISNYIASTSGLYSLAVSNIYGCSATSPSTIVTVNPVPNATVSVSGQTTFCLGGDVVLSVSSSAVETYQWQNNGIDINGSNFNSYIATSSGSYSIIINNTYGCTSSSIPINVTVSTYPNASIDNQGISSICQGGSVLLSANSGPGLTYLWSNGVTTASYLATSAGSYLLTVTNSSGCSTTSFPTVITLNLINATIYPTSVSMNTGYVKSTGSKTSGSMLISLSSTYGRGWVKFPLTSIPLGSVINDVTIKFYTFGGTSSTSSNTIRGFTGDPVTMTGSTLYSTIGSGTTYNTSTWTIGTSTTPSLNTKVLSSAVAYVQSQLATGYVNFGFVGGNTNLQSIYGYNNTTFSVRLEISYIPPAPSAAITSTNNTIFCQGNSVTLNANTGTGLSYQWKNNGINVFGTNPSYSALSSGNYTVQVSNASGCSAISNPITVIVNPLPVASLSNSGSLTFCQGGSVILNANIDSGLTYQWKKNGVIISGITTSSYLATTSGSYTVVITNSFGCSATSSALNVTVNTLPNPVITLSGPATFCQGDTVSLSIDPTNNSYFQWIKNGVNLAGATNNNFVATSSGQYSVFVTNINGCTSLSPSINILVNPLPSINLNYITPTQICQGNSFLITANSSSVNYQWYKNNVSIAGATLSSYTANQQGNYYVKVTSTVNGCKNYSNTVNLIVNPLPTLSITGDTMICNGQSTILTANSNGNITWNGNQNQSAVQVQPTSTTTYTVSALSSNNCQSQEQITVYVGEPTDTNLFISSYGPLVFNGLMYSSSGVFTQTLNNIYGCDSLITLNLNIEVNGVDETDLSKIVIFPNPNRTGEFTLNNSDEKVFDVIVVHDQFGRQVPYVLEQLSQSNYSMSIPYIPGIYFVGIRIGEKMYYRKCSVI
jgi:hypothetical protein